MEHPFCTTRPRRQRPNGGHRLILRSWIGVPRHSIHPDDRWRRGLGRKTLTPMRFAARMPRLILWRIVVNALMVIGSIAVILVAAGLASLSPRCRDPIAWVVVATVFGGLFLVTTGRMPQADAWRQSYWLHDMNVGDKISLTDDQMEDPLIYGSPSLLEATVAQAGQGCEWGPGTRIRTTLSSPSVGYSLTVLGRATTPPFRFLLSLDSIDFPCVTNILVDADQLVELKASWKRRGRLLQALPRESAPPSVEAELESIKPSLR